MELKGKVLKIGDNIDTDVIIPARYLNISDAKELAKFCFADLDLTIPKETILLGGKNFGCGSSREHAPLAIKAAGISCIIATSFARIFYRNAINIGLPIFTSQEVVEESSEGDLLEIETNKGEIRNTKTKKTYHTNPLPPFIHEIVSAGGLMEYLVRRLKYDH